MTTEEQAVLSYLLYGYNEIFDIMPRLSIEYFQDAEARQVFSACRKLWQERKPIEINLLNKHNIEQTYRDGYSIDKYLAVLATEKDRADLKRTLMEAVKAVDSQDPAAVKEMIDSRTKLAGGVSMKDVYGCDRMFDSYRDHVETLKKNTLKTGFEEIDQRTRGSSNGETLFIIARSGSYKTALLQWILKNHAENTGGAVVMFSLEMPIASLTERYLQMQTKQSGYFVEREFQQGCHMNYRQQFMVDMANFYAVEKHVSLQQAEQYVRLIEQNCKIKVTVIGFDYLQYIEHPTDKEYERISALAKDTKKLSKRLQMPVIMLSQTSRAGGGDGDQEINLSAGRGSGSIEESADILLGAFKNADDDLIIKILKNRKGKINEMFKVDLSPVSFSFTGRTTEYTPPKRDKKERGFNGQDAG